MTSSSSSLIGGGIRHSLSRVRLHQDRSLLSDHHHPCSCSMPPPRHHHHLASGRIVASASVAVTSEATIETSRRERRESESLAQKKIDAWMRISATEIVTSLKDAPLLIHVYGGDENSKMTTETKKRAERGNWAELTTAPLPEGVIFVKELTDENDDVCDGVKSAVRNEATKIWGLVVQGRGCGPVCYLLKTCRVEVGSGVACIHFLLLRVNDFREKASSQLRNCWLLHSTGPAPYTGICFG